LTLPIATATVGYHEPVWRTLVDRFRRERIPFLEPLVDFVSQRLEFEGRSAIVCDDRSGCTSLYVARHGARVTCCVAEADEASDLMSVLKDAGTTDVSVLLQVPTSGRGVKVFPFLGRQFDVAVIVVGFMQTVLTDELLREAARALRYGGRLALVVWAFPHPVTPSGPTATTPIDSPAASSMRIDLIAGFIESLREAGFRKMDLSWLTLSCTAPSFSDFIHLVEARRRLKPRRITHAEAALLEEAPVSLEALAAVVVADRDDVAQGSG
jgi:SAM-dependent methyltransferase